VCGGGRPPWKISKVVCSLVEILCNIPETHNNTGQDFEVKHSIDEKWAGSSQLLENKYNTEKL